MTDNLTPSQRSYCMSRVRSSDTGLEKLVCNELRRKGFRFKTHVKDLPGTPDIVFGKKRVAVFVDGDFWHGYRFPQWETDLSKFWRRKISENRLRDRRNHRKLRYMGWRVIRLWGHQIKADLNKCVKRVLAGLPQSVKS